jgi:hypothetical protein
MYIWSSWSHNMCVYLSLCVIYAYLHLFIIAYILNLDVDLMGYV